jgi:proline iminopeptidase
VGRLVPVAHTRLFVIERGDGFPLIVLHGGPGADHTQLTHYLEPLTNEYRLVLVDQRSQGRSDPAPKRTWTAKHMAGDVRALAESLDLDRYAVLGHSYGALVVLQHAVDYPGAAAASVVSHGVPSPRWYRLEEELARFEPNDVRDQIARAWKELETITDSVRTTQLIAQQAPFHFRDPLDPGIEEMNRRMGTEMVHTPEVNRHMSATGYGGFDVEGRLDGISQPVLILTGRHERVCPLEASEFMADRIPGAELVIFENSSHVSYAEEPGLYVQTVRDFLRQHTGWPPPRSRKRL